MKNRQTTPEGVVPGAREEIVRYLPANRQRQDAAPRSQGRPPAAGPDPVLDAPIPLTWALPRRPSGYKLTRQEILAFLHRDIRRPLVLDGDPPLGLEQPSVGPSEFRVAKRPLREVLSRFFPGWDCHSDEGAIFIRNPERRRSRLNQVPRTVQEFLNGRKEPFTLDDLSVLSRSLAPWQIVKLNGFLPKRAIDQMLATQELLCLYGELAPTQRQALRKGLSFTALTPAQQAQLLAFAQRQRPYVEPWRFQNGGLRLATEPPPSRDDGLGGRSRPVARVVFHVRFDEDDAQSFAVDLFPQQVRTGWQASVRDLVGKRFPFPVTALYRGTPVGWTP